MNYFVCIFIVYLGVIGHSDCLCATGQGYENLLEECSQSLNALRAKVACILGVNENGTLELGGGFSDNFADVTPPPIKKDYRSTYSKGGEINRIFVGQATRGLDTRTETDEGGCVGILPTQKPKVKTSLKTKDTANFSSLAPVASSDDDSSTDGEGCSERLHDVLSTSTFVAGDISGSCEAPPIKTQDTSTFSALAPVASDDDASSTDDEAGSECLNDIFGVPTPAGGGRSGSCEAPPRQKKDMANFSALAPVASDDDSSSTDGEANSEELNMLFSVSQDQDLYESGPEAPPRPGFDDQGLPGRRAPARYAAGANDMRDYECNQGQSPWGRCASSGGRGGHSKGSQFGQNGREDRSVRFDNGDGGRGGHSKGPRFGQDGREDRAVRFENGDRGRGGHSKGPRFGQDGRADRAVRFENGDGGRGDHPKGPRFGQDGRADRAVRFENGDGGRGGHPKGPRFGQDGREGREVRFENGDRGRGGHSKGPRFGQHGREDREVRFENGDRGRGGHSKGPRFGQHGREDREVRFENGDRGRGGHSKGPRFGQHGREDREVRFENGDRGRGGHSKGPRFGQHGREDREVRFENGDRGRGGHSKGPRFGQHGREDREVRFENGYRGRGGRSKGPQYRHNNKGWGYCEESGVSFIEHIQDLAAGDEELWQDAATGDLQVLDSNGRSLNGKGLGASRKKPAKHHKTFIDDSDDSDDDSRWGIAPKGVQNSKRNKRAESVQTPKPTPTLEKIFSSFL